MTFLWKLDTRAAFRLDKWRMACFFFFSGWKTTDRDCNLILRLRPLLSGMWRECCHNSRGVPSIGFNPVFWCVKVVEPMPELGRWGGGTDSGRRNRAWKIGMERRSSRLARRDHRCWVTNLTPVIHLHSGGHRPAAERPAHPPYPNG